MIRKIKYTWHEGDYGEAYIVYDNEEQLEKDLVEAQDKANEHTGYRVRCLPSFYDFIIKHLEEQGYIIDYYFDDTSYDVDDDMGNKVAIQRRENKVDYIDLK